jgi:branched-chain amino acid aminotransferase
MECRIDKIALNTLYQAEEVFITGSGKGLVPVVQVDDHTISSGQPGPITRRLMEALGRHKK